MTPTSSSRTLAHDPAGDVRAPRSKEETLLLMAYADGELDDVSDPTVAADRARIEALLASDADARALLADMTEIAVSSRQWVREAAAASNVHASVPGFDITREVMAAVDKDAKSAPIDLAARRARTLNKTQNMAVLGMLAVAAAAIFVLRGRANDDTASNAGGQMDKATAAVVAAQEAAKSANAAPAATQANAANTASSALAQNGMPAAPLDVAVPRAGEIQVNSVAAPNHDVKVFYPQAGDTTASVVVWIEDSKP